MKKLYTWTNTLNSLFWARVVDSTNLDVRSLSAFRILLGTFLLATYIPGFSWIAEVPQALFNPPVLSIANLFNKFPDISFFFALDCLVLLSLVGLTLGIKARLSTLLFLISWTIGLNFKFSFGKIDHSLLLLSALLFCMAFSGWGRKLAILPDNKTKFDSTSKSLSLLSVLLCFAMFTAGIIKAMNWIDFDLDANGFLSWHRSGYFQNGRQHLLAPYVNYFPAIVVEFFDYAAVGFELSPLLFLLHSRKGWRLWLLTACTFHMANTLMLNILFVLNFLAYIVFVDFTWLYDKFQQLKNSLYVKYCAFAAIALIVLFRGLHIFNYDILLSPLTHNETWLAKQWLDLAIWGVSILLIVKSLNQKNTSDHEDVREIEKKSAVGATL